jgi:hypothetical protein
MFCIVFNLSGLLMNEHIYFSGNGKAEGSIGMKKLLEGNGTSIT